MIYKEGSDGTQPIMIVPFLGDFRVTCNYADVHEGAAVRRLRISCAVVARVYIKRVSADLRTHGNIAAISTKDDFLLGSSALHPE